MRHNPKWMPLFMAAALLLLTPALGRAQALGTPHDPVVDSALTPREAIYSNQPPGTPEGVLRDLELIDVLHHGFDGKVHKGQLVVHKDLAQDVREVFALMLEIGYPVYSVLPVAHPEIQKKGPYGMNPDTDNTSAYVYRDAVGGGKLSMHATGRAVDINPRQNPYIRGEVRLPPRSAYDPEHPATLTPEHPVVQAFKSRGWNWGGDWQHRGLVDYMHFEKPAP